MSRSVDAGGMDTLPANWDYWPEGGTKACDNCSNEEAVIKENPTKNAKPRAICYCD